MESLYRRRFLYDLEPWTRELSHLAAEWCRQLENPSSRAAALTAVLRRMPDIRPAHVDLGGERIVAGRPEDLADTERESFVSGLRALMPWRKGPFELFGTVIDSEWDSSLKWDRIRDRLPSLAGRRILDIGCSNGYYMFRMAAQEPQLVLGIEPHPVYYGQFMVLQQYLRVDNVHCLPVPFESLPPMERYFDAVFCMGILYHRRSPLETLQRIATLLSPGGVLVLETLVVEGEGEMALFPRERYAGMNNVFFIPTVACLTNWLARAGFDSISVVDVTVTTEREQRRTLWSGATSLQDFLDAHHPGKTVEGYPAPIRAMALCRVRR